MMQLKKYSTLGDADIIENRKTTYQQPIHYSDTKMLPNKYSQNSQVTNNIVKTSDEGDT
jgi:hypothetical protein